MSKIKQIRSAEFAGGGHYGIEIPSVNSLRQLESVITSADAYSIPLAQVNEVVGASLIPENELSEMLHLAAERKLGLTLSSSVRPEYDIDTAFYRTPWGREQARRINHPDKLKYALDEIMHLYELGCRGFILYDLGLMRMVNEQKIEGNLPSHLVVKASTHCGITNHVTALIHVENGVNDVIPMHDLAPKTLLAIRAALPGIPLSIIVDTYSTKGGFIRIFDLPDIVSQLSPIFLKMGNSLQSDPFASSSDDFDSRLRRIRGILDRFLPRMENLDPICETSLAKAIPLTSEPRTTLCLNKAM